MSLPPSLTRITRLLQGVPVSSALRSSARGVAFWTAVALPFSYLPLFTLDFVRLSVETFVLLLLINVVALVVGHPYHR